MKGLDQRNRGKAAHKHLQNQELQHPVAVGLSGELRAGAIHRQLTVKPQCALWALALET